MIGRRLACRRLVCVSVCLELIGVGLATLGPVLLKHLIDRASSHGYSPSDLALDIAAFVLAWTGTSFVGSLRNVASTQINGKVSAYLIINAIAGYLGRFQPGDQNSGKLLSDFERLGYSLAIVIDGVIWRVAPLILQFIVSLTVILRLMSWRYLAVMACLACGFIAVSWLGARRHDQTAKRVSKAYGENAGLIGDVLRNAERVVCNGAIPHEIENVGVTLSARTQSATLTSWSLARLSGMQYSVIATGLFTLLLMAGTDLGRGAITTGEFVLIQAYGLNLVLPMATIGFVISQSATAIANIADVLTLQGDRPDSDAPALDRTAIRPASITLQDLTFSYSDGVPVIRNISAEFPSASFTAIVGRNGSGKSTLAKLVAGRLVPGRGEITYDGVTLSNLPAKDRVRRVLYLPQRVALMNRSLIANLTYPPVSHDGREAVERLRHWDFFESDRDIDLLASVGESGARLSGGQAQKLELARLADVEVSCLILDEATSAMDPASEEKVLRDLLRLRGTKTTLIAVTHRIAIAEEADQVLWMVDGEVAALGGHEDLMRIDAYRSLWMATDL